MTIPDRLNAIVNEQAAQRELQQKTYEAVTKVTEPGTSPASPELLAFVDRAKKSAQAATTLADRLAEIVHQHSNQ